MKKKGKIQLKPFSRLFPDPGGQGILNFGLVRGVLLRRRPLKGRIRGGEAASPDDPDMEPHYDFSGGVRGKYAARYAEGTNVVVLAPDVSRAFPDSDAVNKALRAIINGPQDPTSSPSR